MQIESLAVPQTFGVEVFGAVAFHCAPLREAHKLIVSFDDVGLRRLLAGFGPGTAALRLDSREWQKMPRPTTQPQLTCPNATFDVAVAYRAARHAANMDLQLLLRELYRVIRPGGSLVLLDHRADFAFAPLPAGGEGQLVRRWLVSAGFGELQLTTAEPQWLITAASRVPLGALS